MENTKKSKERNGESKMKKKQRQRRRKKANAVGEEWTDDTYKKKKARKEMEKAK